MRPDGADLQSRWRGTDVSGLAGLQRVDYKYNIRGWLKEINDVNLLAKDPNKIDLFAFRIQYDDPVDDTPQIIGDESTPLFNGNISETYWRSSSDQILRKYSYQYDHLNRLSAAIYQKPEQAVNVTHSYDEELSYDKNGNITSLQRNGHMDDPLYALAIDDLQFTYIPKSNLLVAVNDATNSNQGFKDGNTTLDDYTYDSFGNLTTDKNKRITYINYNHLNLPTVVVFENGSKINYFYDANGKKVAKVVNGTTRTDYCQGFQYVNNILKFFAHAEGYVNAIHREGNYAFDYAYNYTDHLGNVRLTYGLDKRANELKILEENHYYPFGLRHTNYNSSRRDFVREESQTRIESLTLPPVYKYKYNGKEWQDELGLNWYTYGFRMYDPAIGRFPSMDPISEKFPHVSTYNYAENEPVGSIDLWGLQRWMVNGRERNVPMPGWRTDARAAGFALRHPGAASQIGTIQSGSTNISSVAGRFARHFAEATGTSKDIGSESNAIRHGLWSAMIRTEFSAGITKRATNSHEGVGIGESQYVDMSKPFSGKGQEGRDLADHIVDVLNNNIGIGIAEANPDATTKDLALLVLNEFKYNGLWTFSTDKNGNVTISRSKISQSQYQTGVSTINSLNNNGFSSEEQKRIDEFWKRESERLDKLMNDTNPKY